MRNRAIGPAMLMTVLMAVPITGLVTACGSSAQPPQVIEQIVVREPGAPPSDAVSEPAANAVQAQHSGAQADAMGLVAIGEDAFQRCTGCHVVEPGARSTAGPNLHGVFGRAAGGLDGYPYSDALANSGIVWNYETLDLYLANPSGYVPGTDMSAGAVREGEARAAIVAYLVSKSPDSASE